MVFIVTLACARPLEEVNRRLDGHRDWLVDATATSYRPRSVLPNVTNCDVSENHFHPSAPALRPRETNPIEPITAETKIPALSGQRGLPD